MLHEFSSVGLKRFHKITKVSLKKKKLWRDGVQGQEKDSTHVVRMESKFS